MNYLVETTDGSKTIFNPQVGENYHSRNGALQESRHVFLNSGLKHCIGGLTSALSEREGAANRVSILEVGFGTGLNFLLSADWCSEEQINLDYMGIEAYPLDMEIIRQTEYDAYVAADLWQNFAALYQKALLQYVQLNPNVGLGVTPLPLMEFKSDKQFDIIYFDAFASSKQPEMWNEAAIAHTISFLKPGGVFVTYAITGNLKRMLKALNCKIEKVPGAAGKREMLRATKLMDV